MTQPHRPAPLPDDLAERVADVLYRRINPGLAQHGGRAELVDVKGGVARVRLSGGCQGCGAAKMTLSLGIEQTLRGEIPELRGVEDVTDHAAGERLDGAAVGIEELRLGHEEQRHLLAQVLLFRPREAGAPAEERGLAADQVGGERV